MKSEFKRFSLEKLGLLIIVLQFLGATGLLVGLKFNSILVVSSLGLALLMLLGLLVRARLKDSLWISLPAFFYMSLNAYIFLEAINSPQFCKTIDSSLNWNLTLVEVKELKASKSLFFK